MRDKEPKSAVEAIKESSRQLRGSIAEELAADQDHFAKPTAQLLKFHGTYQQDDRDARRRRQPGQGKSARQYILMVRTKVPAGRLTAGQFLTELELADRYGNGTLRVTTRQGLQLHGVLKRNLQRTIHDINQCLLTTLGACGDVERNVMSCPAPLHDGLRAKLQQVAERIASHLAPRTRAYHEIWVDGTRQDDLPGLGTPAEEPLYGAAYLPRKFKTALALTDDNCVDLYSNDLGLLAVLDGDRFVGFNVLVGGGLGTSPAKKQTFPALAKPMGFVSAAEVLPVVTAVVAVQRDFGRRDDRSQARLKYLVRAWGLDKFKAKVQEYLGRDIEPPRPAEVTGTCDHLGWHAQGDGSLFLGLYLACGRIKDRGPERAKTALRRLLERFGPHGMNVRLTPQQNVLLTDIDPAWQPEIDEVLGSHGLRPVEQLSAVRRAAMACPALPTCGLAVAESERVLPSVIEQIEKELAAVGLAGEHISVHMTGCPNGCARPYNCDVGLIGRSPGKYALHLGGNATGTRLNFLYQDTVPEGHIAQTLRPLLAYFRAERRPGEPFGDFCHRKGPADLTRFAQQYAGPHPTD